MRRSASEIIRNLEMRVARLEKQSNYAKVLAMKVVKAITRLELGRAFGEVGERGKVQIVGDSFQYTDYIDLEVLVHGLKEEDANDNKEIIKSVSKFLKFDAIPSDLRRLFIATAKSHFGVVNDPGSYVDLMTLHDFDQRGLKIKMGKSHYWFRVDQTKSRGVSISKKGKRGGVVFHLCVKAQAFIEIQDPRYNY